MYLIGKTIWIGLAISLSAMPQDLALIGSGHRGLVFVQLGPGNLMAIAYNINSGFPLSPSYGNQNMSKIIFQETMTNDYICSLPNNFFNGWNSCGLFSFDDHSAFADSTVFRVENGHLRIYQGKKQEWAQKQYGLKVDEIFLGAFGGNTFFWKENQPQYVFYISQSHTYRFKTHSRVTEPLGMSRGEPKGDLALRAVVKPKSWFYPSPRTFEWIILNFKDAQLVG